MNARKNNCKENRYIGESGRPLKFQLAEHRGYVVNQAANTATGAHFNLPGHSLSDLKIIILDQVKIRSDQYIKESEKYFIKFNTLYEGLNRQL